MLTPLSATRPRQVAVKLAQTMGLCLPLLAFDTRRRSVLLLKPQERQRLVPLIDVKDIFEETAIAFPVIEPFIGLSLFRP